MEISNATNNVNSQESGDPQSSVKAEVSRCQGECAHCAFQTFIHTNRSSPQGQHVAEHHLVDSITGIASPLVRITITKPQRKTVLAEQTENVLACDKLNGDTHAILRKVEGAHMMLRMTVPEALRNALQQSDASSQ